MIAPLTAPHIPPVRDMPLQKPVAILGIKSDWIPWLSAIACSTLSAQKRPDLNSSRLRCGACSLMFQPPVLQLAYHQIPILDIFHEMLHRAYSAAPSRS